MQFQPQVEAAPEPPRPDFASNAPEKVRSINPLRRVAGVRELAEEGPDAVPLLCEMLQDPNSEVRSQAAENLARIGDAGAVQPLIAALRNSLTGGSARLHLWRGIGVAILMAFGLVLVVALALGTRLHLWQLVGNIWRAGTGYFGGTRQEGRVCGSISRALAAIAAKQPTPELLAAVPDLERISADLLQQDPETRLATGQAAQQIRACTERLRSMPIPSGPNNIQSANLPLPSSSTGGDS